MGKNRGKNSHFKNVKSIRPSLLSCDLPLTFVTKILLKVITKLVEEKPEISKLKDAVSVLCILNI